MKDVFGIILPTIIQSFLYIHDRQLSSLLLLSNLSSILLLLLLLLLLLSLAQWYQYCC